MNFRAWKKKSKKYKEKVTRKLIESGIKNNLYSWWKEVIRDGSKRD